VSAPEHTTTFHRILGRRYTPIIISALLILGGVSLIGLVTYFGFAGSGNNRASAAPEVRELAAAGNLESARVRAEQAFDSGDRSPETLALLGMTREAEGDLDGASAAYRAALEVDPNQPTVHHDLAVLLAESGDLDAAAESLRSALELDPNLIGSRLLLGDVLARLGDADGAAVEYRAVIEVAPVGLDLQSVRDKLAVVE